MEELHKGLEAVRQRVAATGIEVSDLKFSDKMQNWIILILAAAVIYLLFR